MKKSMTEEKNIRFYVMKTFKALGVCELDLCILYSPYPYHFPFSLSHFVWFEILHFK